MYEICLHFHLLELRTMWVTLVLKIYKSFYCAKVLGPLISWNYLAGQEIALILYLKKEKLRENQSETLCRVVHWLGCIIACARIVAFLHVQIVYRVKQKYLNDVKRSLWGQGLIQNPCSLYKKYIQESSCSTVSISTDF